MSTTGQPVEGRRVGDFVILYLVAAAVSFGQARVFLQYHLPHMDGFVVATSNFFHGETIWRVFQSRVLGPALVVALQKLLVAAHRPHEYADALTGYYCAAIPAANLLFLTLAVKLRRNLAFGFACLFGIIGFQTVMWTHWYYPWDPLEFALFSTLILGDLATEGGRNKRGWLFFYALFAVWVFTKETAIFVPVWLVLTRTVAPAVRSSLRAWWSLNRVVVANACVLLISCSVITKVIRDRLFVHSVYPEIGTDDANRTLGNVLNLPGNLRNIAQLLWRLVTFHLGTDYGSLYAFAILCLLVYAGWRLRSFRSARMGWAVLLFASLYFASVMLSGDIGEPRIYMPFAPIALAVYIAFSDAKVPAQTRAEAFT